MKAETKQLARALAMELIAISDVKKCEWITEKRTLDEFPFSKDKLQELRLSGKLEYRSHWKHTESRNEGQGRGRSSNIIYHRQRMIEFVDSL